MCYSTLVIHNSRNKVSYISYRADLMLYTFFVQVSLSAKVILLLVCNPLFRFYKKTEVLRISACRGYNMNCLPFFPALFTVSPSI